MLVSMKGATPTLVCPVCHCQAVIVEPGRASACLPLPPVEALRCPDCGNTGTQLRLRERTLLQWARGG